jgi:hypothetical protein
MGINGEQMQIFIPVLIVEKHDVAAVGAPILPGDRPAAGAGDGCPAAMLSTGETQTFSTPSAGASHDNERPSGDNFAPKNVGLSNSLRRGMRGPADIWIQWIRTRRCLAEFARFPLSSRQGTIPGSLLGPR